MAIYKTLIIVIIASFFCGCNSKKTGREEKNVFFQKFPQETKLKGKVVQINKEIYGAYKVWLQDSLLIIGNQISDTNHLHLINLKSSEYLFSFLKKGRGPEELTSVSSGYLDKRTFFAHDVQTQTLLRINLDSLLTNSNYMFKSLKTFGERKSMVVKLSKMKKLFIGMMMPAYGGRFSVFDDQFNPERSFGDFPPLMYKEGKAKLDSIRFLVTVQGDLFQGEPITIPKKNLFIVAHSTIDLIEIFDMKSGKLIHNIIGPEQNYPVDYKLTPDGYGVPCVDCKYGYNSIKYKDGFLFSLYSGKKHGRGADLGNQIFQFDLSGQPIKKFVLDQYISDFVISESNKIYCISPDSDIPLYEYDLSL